MATVAPPAIDIAPWSACRVASSRRDGPSRRSLPDDGAGDDVVDMMLVGFEPRDHDEGGDGVRRKPDFPA